MPRYDYSCPRCGFEDERIVSYANCHSQQHFCPKTGRDEPLTRAFPTGQLAVCYNGHNDTSGNPLAGPPVFTGPAQKERFLRDRGLIALGSEKAETVHRTAASAAADREEKVWKEAEREMNEGLQDLGDALYARDDVGQDLLDRLHGEPPDSSFVGSDAMEGADVTDRGDHPS